MSSVTIDNCSKNDQKKSISFHFIEGERIGSPDHWIPALGQVFYCRAMTPPVAMSYGHKLMYRQKSLLFYRGPKNIDGINVSVNTTKTKEL